MLQLDGTSILCPLKTCQDFHASGLLLSFCLEFSYSHSLPGKHIWDSTQMSPLEEPSLDTLRREPPIPVDTAWPQLWLCWDRAAVLKHRTLELPGGLLKIHVLGFQPQNFWLSTSRARPGNMHLRQNPRRFLCILILESHCSTVNGESSDHTLKTLW